MSDATNGLDIIAGHIELAFPGRAYIIWLFDDSTKHEDRLLDTPVDFAASASIGGMIRAQNLMREKLEKWRKEESNAS